MEKVRRLTIKPFLYYVSFLGGFIHWCGLQINAGQSDRYLHALVSDENAQRAMALLYHNDDIREFFFLSKKMCTISQPDIS